jgi:GntR family transcriptional regulator
VIFEIKPDDPRPVFQQIVDEVHRSVAVGVLKPGDALPAVRKLAADLKINANTVQHAYRQLELEGRAVVKRGLGTFVAVSKDPGRQRPEMVARQIAERALREAFRHGLLASDLIAALEEIAPGGARRSARE